MYFLRVLVTLCVSLNITCQSINGDLNVISQQKCSNIDLSSNSCKISCDQCFRRSDEDRLLPTTTSEPTDVFDDVSDILTAFTELRTTDLGKDVCTLVVRGQLIDKPPCDGSDQVMWLDVSTLGYNGLLSHTWSFENLKYLDMSHASRLRALDDDSVFSFYQLEVLIAHHNRFGEISRIFRYTKRLREIDLSFSEITVISREAFSELEQLRRLDLSHNKIKHIGFRFSTNILYLNLANNQLNEKELLSSLSHYSDNRNELCPVRELELNASGNSQLTMNAFLQLFETCNASYSSVVVYMDNVPGDCFEVRQDRCSAVQFLQPGCDRYPICTADPSPQECLTLCTAEQIAAVAGPSALAFLLLLLVLGLCIGYRRRSQERSAANGDSEENSPGYTGLQVRVPTSQKDGSPEDYSEIGQTENRDSGIANSETSYSAGLSAQLSKMETLGPPVPSRRPSIANTELHNNNSSSATGSNMRSRTTSEGPGERMREEQAYNHNYRFNTTGTSGSVSTRDTYLESQPRNADIDDSRMYDTTPSFDFAEDRDVWTTQPDSDNLQTTTCTLPPNSVAGAVPFFPFSSMRNPVIDFSILRKIHAPSENQSPKTPPAVAPKPAKTKRSRSVDSPVPFESRPRLGPRVPIHLISKSQHVRKVSTDDRSTPAYADGMGGDKAQNMGSNVYEESLTAGSMRGVLWNQPCDHLDSQDDRNVYDNNTSFRLHTNQQFV